MTDLKKINKFKTKIYTLNKNLTEKIIRFIILINLLSRSHQLLCVLKNNFFRMRNNHLITN